MKVFPKYFLSCCLTLFSGFCFSQDKIQDSLWSVYNNKAQADTNRLKALNEIAASFTDDTPDTAIILSEQLLLLAEKTGQKKYTAAAFHILGSAYDAKGNFPKSLANYLKALKIFEEIKSQKGMAGTLMNIGIIYKSQYNKPKALEYFFKALKTYEEVKNEKGIANCYHNISGIYMLQENAAKAIEYDLKALAIYERINYTYGIGFCYGNLGHVYRDQKNYTKSLEYFLKALSIRKSIGDKHGIGNCYINIGEVYNDLLNFKLAIQYGDSGLILGKETGDIYSLQRLAYQNLADAYGKSGQFKQAYEFHVKFKQLTDSVFNEENSKQLGDLKTQFEVEKKEAELKIKAEAQEAINAEEKKKQQVIIYAVAGVLLLVIIFSLFLFNRFHITQKQKKIIEEQKLLVDSAYETLHEKNKEVMDSIYYARRIQRALIPSEKYIERQLNTLMKN